MRKHLRRFAAIVVLVALLTNIAVPMVYAGDWVSDWLSNATSSGGGSYQTQQRGYFMGGNYSLHTPSKTDNFSTARAPSFSAGCGGIDFFAGSISFMSADQLVAKLQRIMQNAAGVAFQMALETLCSKCVQIMNSMESIANALNSMSMNDCQAAKGLVTATRGTIEAAFSDSADKTVTGAVQKGMTDSGWPQMNTAIQKAGDALSNLGTSTMEQLRNWGNGFKDGTKTGNSPTTSGCAGFLGEMLPATNKSTSVLEYSGDKVGLSSEHREMIRGLIGDIAIVDTEGALYTERISGCADNAGKAYEASGDIYTRAFVQDSDISVNCSTKPVKQSVKDDIKRRMKTVADAIGNKSALGQDDLLFLGKLPLPIMQGLRMAVAVGAPDELIDNLSGAVADMHIIMAIRGAVTQARSLTASFAVAVSTGAAGSTPTCNVNGMNGFFSLQSAEFNKEAGEMVRQLNADLDSEIIKLDKQLTIADHFNRMALVVERYATQTFGASVSERAMAKAKAR